MSASNHYRSTQSSCSNNSCCDDEENYNASSKCLKFEDEQIYITEENSDSFCEKRGLVSNNFSLQNHEGTFQFQQQKLNAIKNLIDPSDQQYQLFGNNTSNSHLFANFLQSQLQNAQNNGAADSLNQACSNKSKKEILKEKRDKKKQQIQEKKVPAESDQKLEEQADKKKEYSKEEKAERQKIKNRESAQLSRDRKKLQENQLQQDLQFMTDENKHLQSLIKQSFTCQQCGYFNNPSHGSATDYSSTNTVKQQYQNCKESHIQLNSDSVQFRCSQPNSTLDGTQLQSGVETSSQLPPGSVYQFFDFSRTNAPLMQASPISFCNFGKGAWSTAFIIFIIYMMLVFSGSQQDGNTTLGQNFRNLQFVGPYAQFIEQYKDFTQDQLLEELLKQLQKLNELEREEQLKQLKLIHMLANAASNINTTPGTEEPSTTAELNESQKTSIEDNEKDFIIEESQSQTSSSSTAANSALLEKIQALEKEVSIDSQPVQQDFLDFCKKYKEIQSSNEGERGYYKDLSKKLDDLQREKLSQLESLKQIYCINIPDSPSFPSQEENTSSLKRSSQEQYYTPKMHMTTPFFSDKQLSNQALNPVVLQDQSLDRLRSAVNEQPASSTYDRSYNGNSHYHYNNSPPTFDNISQFFNDTASFKEDGGMNSSSMSSSQNLDTEDDRFESGFNQDQQQYQQQRTMMRHHQMQAQSSQYYNNQQGEQMEEDHLENKHHMMGEEEDPFSVIPQVNPKKSSINYYELIQRKNGENQPQQQQQQQQQQQLQQQQSSQNNQGYATQQIACQYSFQQYPNQVEDYNISNSTNINLQSVQNGKVQQFNLQFSPYQNSANNMNNNGKDEQQFFNNDVEKYIKFSCKFVDNNCISKDGY